MQGNTVIRTDKGYTEQYFGLYNAGTNPGGATVAGWYPVHGKAGPSAAPTLTGIYTTGSPAARVYMQGGRVYTDGGIGSSSAVFNAGTQYALGTIPVAYAPSRTLVFAVSSNNVHALFIVDVAGNISITLSAGFTGTLNLSLGGPSWPIAALG